MYEVLFVAANLVITKTLCSCEYFEDIQVKTYPNLANNSIIISFERIRLENIIM
jgi:hypothetical protein